MSQDVATQIARCFIQNRDVKAIQFSNGDYVPDFRMKDQTRHGLGFTMESLTAHLEERETYGHYLLDKEGMCRMFAFDIDLEKEGNYVVPPGTFTLDPRITNQQYDDQVRTVSNVNPREIWLDRNSATAVPEAREWYKEQMMKLVHRLSGILHDLKIPAAAAYSGSKGVHVYGFTGTLPAEQVRFIADNVMSRMEDFEPTRGKHFFGSKNLDPIHGYKNFSIEIFPKQTEAKEGGLGNLMRLPLGRNQKSDDPTFFLDLKAPAAKMRPHPNPAALLESGDPYA